MKKHLTFISLLLIFSPLSALGFNANFALDAGISENLLGEQIKNNNNLWNDFPNAMNYLNAGGTITTDIIFTENISAETGFTYKKVNLNYITTEDNLYGNGNIHLNYSVLQFPVLFKYTIPLKKTTETLNSVNIAAGVYVSCNLPNQSYTDDITTFAGNFLAPLANVGTTLKATYAHKLGPGHYFVGLKFDYNFINKSYKIGERNVNIGNTLSISPMIGFTFIIKEDTGLSKITEKNKRIKDIDVD